MKRREHCGTGNAWGAIFNCRHRIVEPFERLVEVFWINADVNLSIFLCSDHLWYLLRRLLYRCDHSDFGHLVKFLLTLFSLTWGTLRGGLKKKGKVRIKPHLVNHKKVTKVTKKESLYSSCIAAQKASTVSTLWTSLCNWMKQTAGLKINGRPSS